MDQLQVHIREHWVSTIALACFALLPVQVVGITVYNIYFHPLSSYPGPILCRVSRIPYWVAFLGGHQAPFMKKLHDKYGDVLRFSPNELSYTDAQAWKEIYGLQKGRPENYKASHLKYDPAALKPYCTHPCRYSARFGVFALYRSTR